MAELITDHIFSGSLEQVFEGIRQYAKYPEYISGVTAIQVLPPAKEGSVCQVRYDLKIVKSFFYTLDMFEEAPSRIWWSLDESNLMKVSNGSWDLKADGLRQTKARYCVEVGFRGLVPSKMVDQITKANLPGMMKGFQQLIDDTVKSRN